MSFIQSTIQRMKSNSYVQKFANSKAGQFCIDQTVGSTKEMLRVRHMPKDVIKAAKTGWADSRQKTKIYPLRAARTVGSVVNNGIVQHLPGILSGVGRFSVLPGGQIIGYNAGKLAKAVLGKALHYIS